MSVANPSNISGEIARILSARNLIRTKLNSMDLASVTDNITTLASTIDAIPNQGTISASVNVGESYTIPRGYHSGSGTVSGAQGSGQFLLQTPDPVTPTKTLQNITPDNGYYGLASVKVKPIPDAYQDVSSVTAQASQVLATKIFVDAAGNIVTGTMTNNGAVNQTISVASPSYTIPSGYHSGSGKVSLVTETKSVTPSAASQDITPTNGKVLSKVTVEAIPAPYYDVSGVTAAASQVLAGSSYVTSAGVLTAGTMTDRGAVNQTLTASSTQYTVPAGYHNGSGVVKIVTEEKSATPTTTAQNITPTSGKVLSKVTVAAIPSNYKDTTNVDATAADVLDGKTIVTGSGEVEGTMPNNGAVSQVLTTSATSYTVPEGYHNGSGTVSIVTETKNATPTKNSQTINPSTGKVLSSVTVAAIPSAYQDVTNVDAAAGDVLAGKVIVAANGTEVTGTMSNNGAISKTLDATTNNQSYTVPAGYHNGSGAVNIVLETKTATPTESQQNITPTSGKVLSKVTVNAIPSKYQDTTNVTATANDVLEGATIVTANGEVEGAIAKQAGKTAKLTIATPSYTIPSGYYYSEGKVSIESQIKMATPTTEAQAILPDNGYVLSRVQVLAIPSKYGDTTGDTGTADKVLWGYKVHTISPTTGAARQITGSMSNNGTISGSIDGLTTTSYTIPSGYTSGGSVSLTNDIETALAAI